MSNSELADIIHILNPLVDKYFSLGVQLGIDPKQIKSIEGNYTDQNRRLTETIMLWQNNNTDECSRFTLATAIERIGGHNNIAKDLRKRNMTTDLVELDSKRQRPESADDTGYSSKNDLIQPGYDSGSETEHFELAPGCNCTNKKPCSLYTLCAGGCPNPTGKRVPILKKKSKVTAQCEIPFEEEHDFERFEKDTKGIRMSFGKLVLKTSRHFKTNDVNIKEFILYLLCAYPVMKPRMDELSKATSFDDVFRIIADQACSWFDYEMIKDLIPLFCASAKSCLDEYEAHFKKYTEQRLPKGMKHIEVGRSATRGGKQLIIKIDKEMEDVNFSDLDKLRGTFASILGPDVRRRDLYLADIREGCIMMKFMITEELVERLFPSRSCLTWSQIKSFKENGIISLKCGKLSWRSPLGNSRHQKLPEKVVPEYHESTPMSSSVLMLESPKREPSQTPPVAFTPGMNGFHLPSSIAKTVAVPEEREALTPSLVSEAPSTKSSFTAGSGLHTVTGTPMLFPSLSLTGGLKKPKRTRRKRCLKCEGCRRKDNCGVCSVCTNPSAINPVCKKRRCELLKIRPSAVPFEPPIVKKCKRNDSQVYRPPHKEPPSSGCVAPPLTVDNVMKAVEGVKNWRGFIRNLKGIYSPNDEARLKDIVQKFIQGKGLYQPSWRRMIYALDKANEIHVADQIRHYGEPVQDPTLTTNSVTEVMELVKDWDSLSRYSAVVPDNRLREIQQRCSTKREIANECASYYVHYHSQSSWTHLACHLFKTGEFAAVEKLKPFLPLRDLTITTEKLVELFEAMSDGYLDILVDWLDLSRSKIVEILRNYHSPSQRREAYLDLYATDHPCPRWRMVAELLHGVGLPHQADVVESTYVQVSERTQQNFNEAMKEGELGFRSGNSFMMGAGGSGKTHTLHAILKEKPPPVRQSTSCIKNPVRAVAQCKVGVSKKTADETNFTRITDHQYSDMLCESAKHLLQPHTGKRLPQSHTSQQGDEAVVARISAGDSTFLPPVRQIESASASSKVMQLEHSGLESELVVRMHAGSKAAHPLDDQDMIDMGDSGGQPMYHEILPVFVSNTMFGMLTVKLNEPLDSHPLVEYYTNGKPIGKPFKSPFTHLQTFRHCMRVLQSTSAKCPKIVFIGTHKDLEHKCKENRVEKERKLLSIIPPNMKDHVLYCDEKSQSLIFAINAKCPGDDDQAVLADLRYLMLRELQKLPRVKIPHRYFALEMAFQRLAKYKNKAILSKEECFKEATKFHFTRESFEDVLLYLQGHKLIMHYSKLLPEVVFIDAQVILDKITELVEHSLVLRAEQPTQIRVARSVRGYQEFKSCGIITREILSQFKSRYIPKLFEEDHMILLFEHLLIFAKVGEGKYLMSCLLEEEAISHPLSLPTSQVVSPLLFYFGPDGPKLGVYCCLLSSLITEFKWKLLMEDGNPVQLSRNQTRFTIPENHPGFITITDSFTSFFQVEIKFPSDISPDKALEVCEKVCPLIRETVLTGIRKASRRLNYNNSIPEIAFLCSNAKHQDTAQHPATVSSSGLLTCTTHPASIFCEMTKEHKLWLGKDVLVSSTGGLGIADLRKVQRTAWDAREQWYNIGLELEIDPGSLDVIKMDNAKTNDCFREMLTTWLKNDQPKPTLAALAEALQSPTVGFGHLAEQILALK